VIRRDFVANVSHELKTPLTSISGYAETLLSVPPDPEMARGFLETILGNARRMQRLVDDLLDLSRIEAGRWQPARTGVDVAAAARESWTEVAARPASQGIEFVVDVAPGAEKVCADLDAIRQVLTNLMENSLRHTPPGAPSRVSRGATATGSPSRFATTAPVSPASTCRESSSGSTGRTPRGRERRAAPAWASRS
jgi:two-component system phosphate regulon sensor histidine kinase PhoR